jgi:hypothetical protein
MEQLMQSLMDKSVDFRSVHLLTLCEKRFMKPMTRGLRGFGEPCCPNLHCRENVKSRCLLYILFLSICIIVARFKGGNFAEIDYKCYPGDRYVIEVDAV